MRNFIQQCLKYLGNLGLGGGGGGVGVSLSNTRFASLRASCLLASGLL